MATRSAGRLRLAAEARRTPVVPNGALGMLMFVASEGMLFAGLISAFHIIRSSALVWPPPDQPRLPVQETLLNTAALLASGVALFLAQRAFRRDWRRAKAPLATNSPSSMISSVVRISPSTRVSGFPFRS